MFSKQAILTPYHLRQRQRLTSAVLKANQKAHSAFQAWLAARSVDIHLKCPGDTPTSHTVAATFHHTNVVHHAPSLEREEFEIENYRSFY
jgi:hypothetical protein